MPRLRRLSHHVAVALTTVALLTAAAPAAHACSLAPPWQYRSVERLEFIGTPLPDTVLAGAGTRTFTEAPGHFGRGTARAIYGQRVRVDQLGNRARRALPVGVREVLLVPWDYAADCRSVPWSRSARFLPDTLDGAFAATLRAREHWAGDLPTFDITPYMQPYTDPVPGSKGNPWQPSPRLTAARLLRLFDELWSPDAILDSTQALEWIARLDADTSLAGKWPATGFVHEARNAINAARMRALHVPVLGTFRLSVTIGDTPPRTLFVRTALRPQPLYATPRAVGDTTLAPPEPGYYVLQASSAPTLDGLAPECWSRSGHTLAYLTMRWHGAPTVDSTGSWDGDLDPRLLHPLLSQTEQVARQKDVLSENEEQRQRIARARQAGAPHVYVQPYRARFARDVQGAMRVQGTFEFENLGTVHVHGERVSNVIMPCRA